MNRFISLSLLLVAIVLAAKCELNDRATFDYLCRRESEEKQQAFALFDGSEANRNKILDSFIRTRQRRQFYGENLGIADCSEVAKMDPQVVVLTDEQLLREIGSAYKEIRAMFRINQDKSLERKFKQMARNGAWRKEYLEDKLGQKCPADLGEPDLAKAEEFAEKLRANFQEQCHDEAYYDHVVRKVRSVLTKVEQKLPTCPFNDALQAYELAKEARDDYCLGGMRDCCTDGVVDGARSEAIVGAANVLLKMADGFGKTEQSIYMENTEEKWEEAFKSLCILEHKTGAGANKFYSAQEGTLKGLHKRTSKSRQMLGKVLGAESCPQDVTSKLVPSATTKPTPATQLDSKCFDERKSKLLCAAFFNLRRRGIKFFEVGNHWCKIYRKFQDAKESLDKPYKHTNCDEQTIAASKEDAEVEEEVLTELLELEAFSERAQSYRKDLKELLKERFKSVKKMKKAFKRDFGTEANPENRKQIRQALELVQDKICELQANDDIKNFHLAKLIG